MIKRIVPFFFLCFVFQVFPAQESEKALFENANKLYENGEYKEAEKMYVQLLEKDYISDDLHYNLGNALFKTNQLAKAILHYEKALKINPSNEDAAYNLELANNKTIDKVEAIPDLFLYRWWQAIYNFLSVDHWAKLTVILFTLALLGFSLFLFSSAISLRKLGFYSILIFTFLALASWFLASQHNKAFSAEKSAIIMLPTVNILSAPSEGSSQLFVLHEGTKVNIKDKTEGWLKVSLPNGNEGWIVSSELEVI